MANVDVVLSFVGSDIVPNGKREPVIVHRGDTLAWKSDEGDVTISLPNAPLAGARDFSSRKGEFTAPKAKVKPDANPGFFDCKATIGGKAGAKVYGIEIVVP
jgi:hypothetical protein